MTFSRARLQLVGFCCMISYILFLALAAAPVSAQESAPQETLTTDYSYTVNRNDNLTLLVRRSLQLYNENNGLSYMNPSLIAAETSVVNNMGSFELKIGEVVSIPEELLVQANTKVANLTDAQLRSWSRYEPIRTDLTSIEPDSSPTYDEAIVFGSSPSDFETEQETETQISNSAITANDASPIWWLIGLVAVLGIFYMMGGASYLKDRINR